MSSPQELNFDECSIVDPADQGPQGLLDCLADLKLMLKEVEVDSKKAKALRHCQEEIERRCMAMLRQSDEKDQIRNLEIDNERLKDRLLFANLARKEAEDKLKIRSNQASKANAKMSKQLVTLARSVQDLVQPEDQETIEAFIGTLPGGYATRTRGKPTTPGSGSGASLMTDNDQAFKDLRVGLFKASMQKFQSSTLSKDSKPLRELIQEMFPAESYESLAKILMDEYERNGSTFEGWTLASIKEHIASELNRFPQCSICLEILMEQDLYKGNACGHKFHKRCIGKWMQEKSTCPYCRQSLESANQSNPRLNRSPWPRPGEVGLVLPLRYLPDVRPDFVIPLSR